jgi:hypothetical protein
LINLFDHFWQYLPILSPEKNEKIKSLELHGTFSQIWLPTRYEDRKNAESFLANNWNLT